MFAPLGVETKELVVSLKVGQGTQHHTVTELFDECGKLTQQLSVCNLYASEAIMRFLRGLGSTLKGSSKYHKPNFISKVSQYLIQLTISLMDYGTELSILEAKKASVL